jgi:hypothetical protein
MNPIRNGNFNSSEIVALTTSGKVKDSFGKPAFTFIDECNMERRLQRNLCDESNARPLSWGKLVERRVFDLLGTDYDLRSLETLQHPTIDCWVGSPDGFRYPNETKAVCDFKCPLTLKSFCQLVDAWTKGGIEQVRADHKDGEKFYWQLVSNACITGCEFAELIVYAPYKSELEEIRELARNIDVANPYKFLWIAAAMDDELPFLVDGGYYKNINVMRFEVPFLDKQFLTERVLLAREMLIPTSVTETVVI